MRTVSIFITLGFMTLVFPALSQRNKQREPIFVQGTAYRNTGWFIGPGITYMAPLDKRQFYTDYVPGGDSNDTLYSGDYLRNGRVGAYLEFGRHHFLEESVFIHHIDYGVHFKMLRGRERFTGNSYPNSVATPVAFDGQFSESFAGLFFNASNILQIHNNWWIQNSIGANVDFRVISKRNIAGSEYGAPFNYPNWLLGQLHYKFGVGWKPEPGIYIVPSVETPILSIYPWDDGKSTLPYFASRYRPLIFTLRIEWMSQSSARRCENQPGKGPDGVTRDSAGKHSHNGLWGPEGKKMKRARKKQDGK